MSAKKMRKLTRKLEKLVEGIIAGKSGAQAARDAGNSPEHPENAGQSGYQAMKEIGDRVRTAMDSAGFTLEQLIEKHLRSKLEARETKFFPWRKSVQKKSGKKGAEVIVEDTIQVIDVRHIEALGIQLGALDIAFRLRGDYAPKKLGLDPDEGGPVNIYLGRIARHDVPGSMISRNTTRRWRCDDGHYGGEGGTPTREICRRLSSTVVWKNGICDLKIWALPKRRF